MSRVMLSKASRRRLYLPAYRLGEAARLTETSPQTLSRWFASTHPAAPGRAPGALLSYLQLVESAFVSTLRSMQISLQRIRIARNYLAKVFEKDFPFAQLEISTDGAHVFKSFVESEGGFSGLVVAGKSGQEAWAPLMQERIDQFEYHCDLALRWYPQGRQVPIVVDPLVSFGAPTVDGTGIALWAISGRFQAGETREEIMEDYGLTCDQLDAAVKFEEMLAVA